MISNSYLNKEGDYSEETTTDNDVFHSAILYHRKKLNIFMPQMLINYIHY